MTFGVMVRRERLSVRLFDICLERLSLALKWFLPALRAIIFPVRVTLSLFENDLFVFMICLPVFLLTPFLQNSRQTLGAFGYRVRQFVVRRDELEEPLQPLLKEAALHVLIPPPQKQD